MKRSDFPHMGWKADFLLQHTFFSAIVLLSDVSRLKDLSRCHVSNMEIITGRNPRGPHEHCTKKTRVRRRRRHEVVPVSSSVRRPY